MQAAESDTGLYKCVARFRSLTFESRQAYVKVADRKVTTTTTMSSSSSSSSVVSNSQVVKPSVSLAGEHSDGGSVTATRLPPPRFYLAPEDRHAQLEDEVIFDCLAQNDASIQVVSSSASSSSFSSGLDQATTTVSNPNATGEHLQFFRYKWLKDGIALDLR